MAEKKPCLRQMIRIPVEYVEIPVEASREDLAALMQKLILDEGFRKEFNRRPEEILRQAGICVEAEDLRKIGLSPITAMVRDLVPQPQAISLAIVIIGVIIGVIAPPRPAE
ncbi:hypothetical protein [Geoalkalibacter halelectricus]|uniref:Uncharacterized protein n=1 Tax=Geoalkalibacter halelectricus TaxID=2847045 RepID=A0ABY5ZKD0_9BACT|nr:hypothetical protein [Geoalkalibacter halelectricus]MDO3376614.1 hypothetical protein [Geoalkalibacter halelectricus]UWZ78427.1 hypothetical protein L9S41_12110 [Geoalkalibacter halelectricus]